MLYLEKTVKETDWTSNERKVFQRDEKGRVLITMLVKDDSSFLSEFSKTETPIISDAVADFLEDSTHSPFTLWAIYQRVLHWVLCCEWKRIDAK